MLASRFLIPAAVFALLAGVAAPPRPVAATAPVPPAAQDESPFVLGILRQDGVVLPFASFTGKDWESSWPDDVRWIELPLTLGDVPKKWWGKPGPPSQFTIWRDGTPQGRLQLDKPVMVSAACTRRVAISSDYRAKELPPPPAVRPYPKDGLVISGPQRVEPLTTVPPGSPEWNAARSVLADPLERAEMRAINLFTDWDHPVKHSERKKVPIELEAIYRAPMDREGWVAYHVEAVKRYAPGKEDEGCGLVTSATGWIGAGPGKKQWTQLSARITYCDRRGVSYFLPLGLMHLRGRTYWIYQSSGYEHERYYVVRPTSGEVTFEAGYTAGSCGGF